MDNFRQFLAATPVNKVTQSVGKWDVVLFTGNYSPINKDEHERIKQFVQNIIRGDKYKNLFAPTVEIGLIFDEKDDEMIKNETECILSNIEKDYITTKFFGLRGFPLSYRRLKWLTLPVPDKSKLSMNSNLSMEKLKSDMLTMYYPALQSLKNNFENVNILIVINPEESNSLPELDHIVTNFDDDTIKIGFMSWKHLSNPKVQELGNIPITGDMIKAIAIMDHEKPDPEQIKSLAYEFNLKKYVDHMRNIHFRVNGEKYIQAFMTLFPSLVVYDDDESNIKENYKVVLEILKKMYFKDEYVSSYQEELEKPEEIVVPDDENQDGDEQIDF